MEIFLIMLLWIVSTIVISKLFRKAIKSRKREDMVLLSSVGILYVLFNSVVLIHSAWAFMIKVGIV